jgi:hypothetical protein
MRKPPLLASGDGRYWYGIPEAMGYPSRSFHYMQVAEPGGLTGTLELEQPDGSLLRETVDPAGSTMLMVHEYDATPEDLPVGLAAAFSTQLHPRYAPYYSGGMPWDLFFVDLQNGAQLMLAVLAFHDTPDGVVQPLTGTDLQQYQVLATLRLPDGRSVPLDNRLNVEHLAYRQVIGRVPTFWVTVTGIWKQAWKYRVSFAGGDVDGVSVPAFDLGLTPQWQEDEPAADDAANALRQRIPFDASGSFGGCPVDGFGWSEIIINWYGREHQDPWWTGGPAPATPAGCGSPELAPPAPRGPGPGSGGHPTGAPAITPDTGCGANNPGTPMCSYTSPGFGGLSGYSPEPGGWTATITREELAAPIVIKSFGGFQLYACGTIRPGDRVDLTADEGAFIAAGNPGICY